MPRVMLSGRGVAGGLVTALGIAGVLLLEPSPGYSHTPITTKITYQKEISKIFQRTCMRCHSDGNIAMSLTTYSEARPWAVAIKEEVLEHRMPPWSAVNGFGHFANNGSLTSREISVIVGWVTGGAPSGVVRAEESTPPVIVPMLNGWETGAPDQVIDVAKGVVVAADSGITTKRFEVATGLSSAQHLRALQFDPGDRRVVQWASVFDAGTGTWLGGWTPLSLTSQLPDGVAFELPAGGKLAVEVGYKSTSEDVSGEGSLGLYFSEARPRAVAGSMTLSASDTSVPAGATLQKVRFEKVVSEASEAGAIFPQLGEGGRSIEVKVVRPNGEIEPMLWVQHYSPQWRSPYIYQQPVALPAGSRVVVTAYFDNPGQAAIQAKADLSLIEWRSGRPASTPGR